MSRPRPRRTVAWAAWLAAAGLVLAGCGGSDDDPGGGQWVGTAGTAAPGAGPATTTAPAGDLLSFTAPAIGGGEVDMASFRGRPTLVWFWAPW